MGKSPDASALAAKCAAAAKAIDKARKEAVKAAAQSVREDIEKSRNKAVGADGRMSRVGRSGAKLGVTMRATADGQRLKATGPWPLIENDVPAHKIGPKKGKKRGVAFNGIVRHSVRHPGTKGKEPWVKGVQAGKPEAIKILRKQTTDAAFGVFKGVT